MARKKVVRKKPKKIFDLTWSFENYEDHPTFYTKRMFGGMASYVHGKMVSLLAESPGDTTYRDKDFGYDIWNGILYPTHYEYQSSLLKDFPMLKQHPVLKKWLYLPLGTKNFENIAHKCALKIKKNDDRFGILPKVKGPKKKKLKKKVTRCKWCGDDPLYVEYHDKEWGIPVYKDQKLFEFLTLESAQAGLSWITVLRKRENYRKAFANFDPQKVARFNERKVKSLLKNAGIIRNELKIRAAINNAKLFLKIQEEFGSFAKYQWSFVDGKPQQNKYKTLRGIPAKTKISDAFSKDLKKRGFKFVGSTIVYAHMQACGMVNDHVQTCFRYQEIKKIKPRKRI